MLDEQLRDLRQQVERGDPFVLVDGDDDDFVSLGRDDGGWTWRRCGPRRRSRPLNFLSCEFSPTLVWAQFRFLVSYWR